MGSLSHRQNHQHHHTSRPSSRLSHRWGSNGGGSVLGARSINNEHMTSPAPQLSLALPLAGRESLERTFAASVRSRSSTVSSRAGASDYSKAPQPISVIGEQVPTSVKVNRRDSRNSMNSEGRRRTRLY